MKNFILLILKSMDKIFKKNYSKNGKNFNRCTKFKKIKILNIERWINLSLKIINFYFVMRLIL